MRLRYSILIVLVLLTGGYMTAQTDSTGSTWRPMGDAYTPSSITTTVEYDAESGDYVKVKRLGSVELSREYMTFEEYQDWKMDQLMDDYWRGANKTAGADEKSGGLLSKIPGFAEISRKLESLIGKPEIKITPSGSAELTFQVVNNYRKDPQIDANKRSVTNFDFDENIQISLNAKIGDLINFDINWNTKATFDFENKIKLKYEGKEDDIIQLLEAADISFPLNTTLIKGSQQLFGFHTKLKFGKLTVDAVVSEKETSTENMQVKGGASSREFEIRADEYEENRHYFLSQYFYERYNKSLESLPVVNSNVKILRVEVWRTNIGAAVTQNRNLLALTDLGESNPSALPVVGSGRWGDPNSPASQLPRNSTNNLMQLINLSAIRSVNNISSYMQGVGLNAASDYEKIESARLLNSSEYTLNTELGFISLSQPLANDQMLAVAFQYQVIGDTTVYQVGELTTDGINDPNTLVVKLLKGTAIDTKNPMWRLMMKNVYFLKNTQISRDNFRLNVLYEGAEGGVGTGYFTDGPKEGIPLIEVMGLDRMDASKQYYYADGVMDWFDSAAFKGGIIQSTTGRVFFPMVEPFGKDLRAILGDGEFADKYCYDSLYTMTKTLAQQYADKNKFYLEGYYTSAVSGEISLGYSVAPGSVTVTAGGVPLIENVDYTVDYTMGTVRIINESILSSGTPISVSSENNSFSMMTKRMLGLHLNYEFKPDLNLGATVMNLYEKPLTQKNNFGEEPTSNTIWGIDFNWKTEVPWITKVVDFLPGISTKAPSNLTLTAEFAHFIPGMTNTGSEDGKTSYIDDFEGAESSIDLKGVSYWHLASTPQDAESENPMFRETANGTGLAYGFNRAKFAWYRIDDIFYSNSPRNITADDRSMPYARRIAEQEVFPNKEIAANEISKVYELNMAFYPEEKGPYNYETDATAYSAGMNAEGKLEDPKSRWGGIMRELDYTDFETQNIQTIEFWMMDPFIDNPEHTGGKLYINLGDISEDILRDGRKSFENGLPTSTVVTGVDTTIWGRVPNTQPVVNAFDNDANARKYQDVGYDGLSSTHDMNDEQSFFSEYITRVGELFGTGSLAYQQAAADPSSDDFRYYRSSYYDDNDVKINDRYKYYNNPEGNSSVEQDSPESYQTAATTIPNVEDINKDNTLSEGENYYEYLVELDPAHMNIGENYIVDIQDAQNVELANGTTTSCRWYQFRIPIREPLRKVGKINGYQSIRFMRMFMRDFEEPIILRFATLELVYGTWRKYTEDLLQPGDYPTGYGENTSLNLGTVNIEENGSRDPVPYVLPPGIEREEWYNSSSSYTQLNEQAVSLDITNLAAGDARAIYRNTSYDLRYYGKMKMYVHAEKKFAADMLNDDDLTLFVRLGSDYTKNYYEYEIPLKLTEWGTSMDDPYAIWPTENNVEIDLQAMADIKTNRNKSIRSGSSDYTPTMLYSEYVDGKKYSVLGRPNLGKVNVIMIGVRNPKGNGTEQDMVARSAIVWINELRLSDYNNKGGWSAMALARTNLADVGNLSLYGAYTSAGFGNLEDKLTDPELINRLNMQATLDFEIGRMLPEKWGMHIPLYVDWAKEIGSPQYNPLDPDVYLKRDLATYQTAAERDSVKRMTQQRKQTTNITLTNVRKERTGKAALKPHFYDFENFSFSYAYSGERSSDEDIEHYNKDQHRGGFSYNYSVQQPKQYRPFAKYKAFNNKNWKILKEFNLMYQPRNLSFSTEVYRDFEETMLRNKSAALIIMKPTYFKQFTWRRDYGLQYDISTNLKLQYNANANARIDEPIGKIETRTGSDSIWHSFLHGGTMQNFQQNIQVTYDIPITKLPYMDFLRLPLSYRANYIYQGASEALKNMGSVIESSSTFTATASANMQTFYNKFKLIKKAQAPPTPKTNDKKTGSKDKDKNKNKLDAKRGMQQNDSLSKAIEDSIHKAEVAERWREVGYFALRFITGLRTFNAQYSQSGGGHIPGYMGNATIVGLDPRNYGAPGVFILGISDNVAEDLVKNDLLSSDTLLNQPHWVTGNRILSMQATLEPIRNMKIDINCTQNYSTREEYYYKYLSDYDQVMGPLSPMLSGSYTTTAWSLATAFRNKDELYQEFLDNRSIVAARLAEMNGGGYSQQMVQDSITGEYYPAGYSGNQQTVLLTSFLATYMGKDVSTHKFTPFIKMPLPNWSISYSGLGKLPFMKKWFSNISITHKYMSTYSIGGFYTDAAISGLEDYDYGAETVLNSTGDYVSPLSMEGVQISEQFNPLIKVAVNMVNSFQFSFSYQKNRTLALSFANNQLTETSRDGITVGAGYRFKDVELHLKVGRLRHDIKSDVVLQFNLTYNSNKTEIRKINQNVNQISSGSQVWMAELSAEYALSTTLTLRAFFQTNINTPFISNAYPNSTTKGGLTVRFSF